MLNKQEQQAGVNKEQVQKQGSLLSMTIKAYVSGVIALFLLASAAYIVLSMHEKEENVKHAARISEQLNNDIQVILKQYVGRVNLLAVDPNLVELIYYPATRRLRQEHLAEMINAEKVMLFARGEEKTLSGDYPRLSFSELDLIYEAEKGLQPRLEFHKLKDGSSHLDIVRPLKQNDKVVGFVLVRLAGASLIQAINRLSLPNARLELSQVLSDGSNELFISWGDDTLKSGNQENSGSFSETNWRLSYWEAPKGWQILGMDWRAFYWLTFFEIIAVLALMMTIFRRLMDHAMIASANVLFGYVRDRLSGKWMGKAYISNLSELQPTLNNMQNLAWTVAPTAEAEVQPEAEKAPKMSAAEASEKGRKEFERSYVDIMYQGEGGIEIDEGDEPPGAETETETEAKTEKSKDVVEKAEVKDMLQSLAETLEEDFLAELESTPESAHETEKTDVEHVPSDNTPIEVGAEEVPQSIFRAYDIRGVVGKTVTPEIVYQIGRAFGTEAWEKGEQTVVIGRDGRTSSKSLADELIKGLLESGRDVIDIGQVPTPVVYFATHYLNARSAVMVTGSHNPPDYNGFKLVLQGETLAEQGIQKIYQRIQSGDYSVGEGSYAEQNLTSDYSARIHADAQFECSLKVVIDCGNGVAGVVAPSLLRSMGCEVIELYCEVDGDFPNHHPDPSQPVNLQALIAAVKQNDADVGLAFDGDGDRLGVIDSRGKIIWPDRQLMLYAREVLHNNPGGQVIYDVKSSRHLHRLIEENGGQPLMWKAGHSLMKAKLKESGAVLAGEMSGHMFFNDRWYGFDDGLYTAVRLLEILSKDKRKSDAVFAELPDAVSTPELLVKMEEGEHFKLVEQLMQEINLPDAQLIMIDGVRAEFKDGWGLVRASNTTPCLMFRFEAQNEQALEHIMALFKLQVLKFAPALVLPF